MKEKHAIMSHLIHIINQHSTVGVALIHYITNNYKDYYIFLTTSDTQHSGKIYEVEQENEDDSYLYEDIPFDYKNEVYFHYIDDLIEALLLIVRDNNLLFNSIYSPIIKKNYQKEWVHNLCNVVDNFNLLDEL